MRDGTVPIQKNNLICVNVTANFVWISTETPPTLSGYNRPCADILSARIELKTPYEAMPGKIDHLNRWTRGMTPRAQQIVYLSHREAEKLKQSEIAPEHLLLGFAILEQGIPFYLIEKQLGARALRAHLESALAVGSAQSNMLFFSTDAESVIDQAQTETKRLNHMYTGVEHLMLAILAIPNSGREMLEELGIDPVEMTRAIRRELDPSL